MKHCLFPENGKFYKVNLHCHTTVSDGHMTPAEVKAAYHAAGYDAVAFTDHEALITHDELTDSHFIALNGYETAVKEEQVSTHPLLRVHHINFIKRKPNDNVSFCFYPENFTPGNCRAQIPFIRYVGERTTYAYTKEFLSHLIEEAHKNGCLVHYNHPRWSLTSIEQIADLPFDGLEIMNTGCRDQGDFDAYFYADLARRGSFPYVVAGDDNHNDKKDPLEGSFGAFTMVCAEAFTYEGLTDALARGDAYTSAGPLIRSAYVEDGMLVLSTSAAAKILLHGEGREVRAEEGVGGYIDRAAFPLKEEELGRFFRIEVIDSKGHHAYTRAYKTKDYLY